MLSIFINGNFFLVHPVFYRQCDLKNRGAVFILDSYETTKKSFLIGFGTDIAIDLLAVQQKSLDRALFLYNFIHEIRSSGVRASITIVHVRKFYKM